MKLKKSIYKTNTEFLEKFEDCTPSKMKRGDYIRLHFLAFNQKTRGGYNFTINQQTLILQKKKTKKKFFKFFSYIII